MEKKKSQRGAQRGAQRGTRKILDKDKVKHFPCIVCPACCELETDGAEVNGARCPKGEGFALQEIITPLRVLTTTVRCETPAGIRMLPVKTAIPVPLHQISSMVREIKMLRVSGVPAIGSTISIKFSGESIVLLVTGEMD